MVKQYDAKEFEKQKKFTDEHPIIATTIITIVKIWYLMFVLLLLFFGVTVFYAFIKWCLGVWGLG